MWEFSITLNSEHYKVAEFLYNQIKKYTVEVDGIIASYNQNDYLEVVIACQEQDKTRLCYYISSFITEAICTYFKKDFLLENLNVKLKDNISSIAFNKALLYFDKETDRYLVNKYLKLDKNIFLEAFFDFKLKVLKNKWLELTKIANANSAFLMTDETFVDLLKFLIDNLEITHDCISIVEDKDGYKLMGDDYKEENYGTGNAEWLIENIIALSPRKINLYTESSSPEISLISKVYEERINIFSKDSRKIVDKHC